MAAGQERFSTHQRQSPAPKNTQTSFQILNTVHLSYKDGFKGSILVWAVIPAESGAAGALSQMLLQKTASSQPTSAAPGPLTSLGGQLTCLACVLLRRNVKEPKEKQDKPT